MNNYEQSEMISAIAEVVFAAFLFAFLVALA